MHINIVVVEDDPFVEKILKQTLSSVGYTVNVVRNGQKALEVTRKLLPDLVILDLGLPDISGHDVFRVLKNDPSSRDIPLLILTGNDRENQEVEMLLGGADDYLTKPFDIPLLMARIQTVLRRRRPATTDAVTLERGPLTLNSRNRVAFCSGREISTLSPKEFDILYLLAADSPNVVERTTVSRRVWGEPHDAIHPRSIDVHIRQIRSKLGGESSVSIETVSGKGYRLRIC
jgi:DNA-binding response OmpR family regulator